MFSPTSPTTTPAEPYYLASDSGMQVTRTRRLTASAMAPGWHLRWLLLAGAVAWAAVPLVWAFLSSVKTPEEY
jgi:hypothetical protein